MDSGGKKRHKSSAQWRAVMGRSIRRKLHRAVEAKREDEEKPQPATYKEAKHKSSAEWAAVMSRSLNKKLGKDETPETPQPRPSNPRPATPMPVPAVPSSEKDTGENRRVNERITYDRQVQWLADKERYNSTVLDISESGLRLTCDKPVKLHTQVRVFIPLPAGEHTTRQMYLLEGVVVRSEDDEVGIFFTDLPLDVRVLIRDLVVSRF